MDVWALWYCLILRELHLHRWTLLNWPQLALSNPATPQSTQKDISIIYICIYINYIHICIFKYIHHIIISFKIIGWCLQPLITSPPIPQTAPDRYGPACHCGHDFHCAHVWRCGHDFRCAHVWRCGHDFRCARVWRCGHDFRCARVWRCGHDGFYWLTWAKVVGDKRGGKPINHRRKFRSETSDNMDSWKAEVRRVRREKIRRKKMQVREKVGTSWNTESRDSLCFSNDLGLQGVEK